MGFITRALGWAVAHKDAFVAGWSVFKALRGARKATQQNGESFRDYYVREGKKTIEKVARNLTDKA